MSTKIYKPLSPLDLGVGKDTLFDFGIKYNHEIEHIYDLLSTRSFDVEKILFNTESGWEQQSDGYYKLSITVADRVPVAAYRSGTTATKNQMVVCGFGVTDEVVDIKAVEPFSGFLVAINLSAGVTYEPPTVDSEVTEYDVLFYDIDGTKLYEYKFEDAAHLEINDLSHPEYDGLTFTGWNYSQNTINSCEYKLCVGATYTVDDKSDHLFMTIPYDNYQASINTTFSGQAVMTIDWGDGSDIETVTNTSNSNSNKTLTHTYETGEDVEVVLKVTNGTVTLINGNTAYATSLTKVYLGDPKIIIGEKAFYQCTYLQYFIAENTITVSGGNQFNGSTVNFAIPNDNMCRNANGCFANCKSLTGMSFANGTGAIASDFANASNITFLYMPISITSIGAAAFRDCVVLEDVPHFPTLLQTLGDRAFQGCIKIPYVELPSLNSLGVGAFRGCSALQGIEFGERATFQTIPQECFIGCNLLEHINIPSTVLTIGTYTDTGGTSTSGPFYGCAFLEEITIPKSVVTIGNSAFKSCTRLKTVEFEAGSSLQTIYPSAFSYCTGLLKISLPDSLANLPCGSEDWYGYGQYGAFEKCTGLVSARVGNKVQVIGNATFMGCTALASVILGEGVTTLKNSCFSDCSSLTSIILPSTLRTIETSVFKNCTKLQSVSYNGTSLSINNVRSYDSSGSFYNCKSLTTYPRNIKSLAHHTFLDCSSLVGVEFDSELTTIPKGCFQNCSKISSLTIHSGITGIGDYAFSGCTNLRSLTFQDGAKITGTYTFNGDTMLSSLRLPSDIETVPAYTFYNCSKLENVIFPASLKTIGSYAFSKCIKINSVYLPNIEVLGEGAFADNTNLQDVQLGDSALTIGSYCFRSTKLRSFTMPNSVTELGTGAFRYCSELSNMSLSTGISSIPSYTYQNCVNLPSVLEIPNHINSIGESAFESCSNLKGIKISSSVTSLGKHCLAGCSLNRLVVPATTTVLTAVLGTSKSSYRIKTPVYMKSSEPHGQGDSLYDIGYAENGYRFYLGTLYIPTGSMDDYLAHTYYGSDKFTGTIQEMDVADMPDY